jgi:hypothetical protein
LEHLLQTLRDEYSGIDIKDPTKISIFWQLLVDAPSVRSRVEECARQVSRAWSRLSQSNADEEYDFLADPLGLAIVCAKYAESIRMMKSVGGASSSTTIQSLTGGFNVGDITVDGNEAVEPVELVAPVAPPYIVPTEKDLNPLKRLFKKAQTVAEKLQILIKNEVLAELYARDPVVSGDDDSHRVWVLQVLRVAHDCYRECCEEDIGVMVLAYGGYRLNLTNFRVKCVHVGGGVAWGKWRLPTAGVAAAIAPVAVVDG